MPDKDQTYFITQAGVLVPPAMRYEAEVEISRLEKEREELDKKIAAQARVVEAWRTILTHVEVADA